jgi:hypothetical protein
VSDEKPKKSWREIDKMRDRSGGGSSRRDARDREKFESSTGYTKYKTNLDRLFSGGLAGQPPEQDEEQKKLYAIEDVKAFYAAATEYLKKNALPEDPRVLDRLLTHPDEDIQEKALTRLEELYKAGTLKVPPALSQRLASVEIDSGDPRIRKRAAELRKAIR